MGAMVMNMAANMLGLGNAATPFGLKAMPELEPAAIPIRASRPTRWCSSSSINATAIHLMPRPDDGVRAAEGSGSPAAIWVPTLFATQCAMTVGCSPSSCCAAARAIAARPAPTRSCDTDKRHSLSLPGRARGADASSRGEPGCAARSAIGIGLALLVAIVWQIAQPWQGVPVARPHPTRRREGDREPVADRDPDRGAPARRVCAAACASTTRWSRARAKGLDVVMRIAPYLVVILVAVGMFRASGALALIIGALDPFTSAIGFPAEALPMALLRPLSGSGAFAVMAEILHTHGPDSFVGMVASTLQGSTETTSTC
jgi:hypothetical protein